VRGRDLQGADFEVRLQESLVLVDPQVYFSNVWLLKLLLEHMQRRLPEPLLGLIWHLPHLERLV
jgi:hypothetical protein